MANFKETVKTVWGKIANFFKTVWGKFVGLFKKK